MNKERAFQINKERAFQMNKERAFQMNKERAFQRNNTCTFDCQGHALRVCNIGLYKSNYFIKFNLIKIRSPHMLPIFYRLFTSRRVGDLIRSFRGQHQCIIN